MFKKLRKWLKQGRWQQVINELYKLLVLAELSDESAVLTAISYLERHGEAGHLAYARFRRRKLPLGSGAIESAVRRVINLRMKGNSLFWQEANAEAMLVLRGLVLSRRWKEVFAKMTESLAYDRRLEWEWQSPDMVAELKAGIAIMPSKPQPHSQEACYATVCVSPFGQWTPDERNRVIGQILWVCITYSSPYSGCLPIIFLYSYP